MSERKAYPVITILPQIQSYEHTDVMTTTAISSHHTPGCNGRFNWPLMPWTEHTNVRPLNCGQDFPTGKRWTVHWPRSLKKCGQCTQTASEKHWNCSNNVSGSSRVWTGSVAISKHKCQVDGWGQAASHSTDIYRQFLASKVLTILVARCAAPAPCCQTSQSLMYTIHSSDSHRLLFLVQTCFWQSVEVSTFFPHWTW